MFTLKKKNPYDLTIFYNNNNLTLVLTSPKKWRERESKFIQICVYKKPLKANDWFTTKIVYMYMLKIYITLTILSFFI